MSALDHYNDIQALSEPLGLSAAAEIFGDSFTLSSGGVEVFTGSTDDTRAFLQDRSDRAATFDDRTESRRDRLEARATKKREQATERADYSHNLVSGIPFGQPILVGHHSEKRHRKTLERSQNAMFKSCDLHKEADHLDRRAKSVGHTGIQSDDMNADIKLLQKIATLEHQRESMKAANKVLRRFIKKYPTEDQKQSALAALIDAHIPGISDSTAAGLVTPDFCGRYGFASYMLTNLGANIRRLKARVSEVQAVQSVTISDDFGNGITVEISDDHKIVIDFPGKPDESTRTVLKSSAFKWSRTRRAWVRKLTANAEAAYTRSIRPMLEGL